MRPYWLICSLGAWGTVACGGAADIPNTPDLRALLASYKAPTATLDQTSAGQALKSAPSLEALERLSAGFEAAESVMTDVDQASNASSGSTGSRIRLQGSINLQIRCPGELRDPSYDEAVNGSISLTLAVAETRIRRSFGGDAKACVLKGKLPNSDVDVKVVLDGPLAFDVGNDIGIGSRWSGEFLAQMPGTLTVLGYEFRGVSGRLTDGRFQYLVTLDEGTIVLELGDGGISILDRGGAWFCRDGEACAAKSQP